MCRVSKSVQPAPACRFSLILGVLVLCLGMTPAARAQWIGRKFMPKYGCVMKVGDRQTKSYGLPFDVSQVSGEWLWTGQGWVQKSKVAPLDEAASYYTEYLRNNPSSAWAYRNRAMAWLYHGELDNALNDYTAAIRLDPRDSITYCDRGMAWYYKGEFDIALKDYAEAIRLDPQYGGGYNGRAWIWSTSANAKYRDGKRAVESAWRACELSDWNELDAIDTLAVANAEAGDFVSAVKYGEQALSMASTDKKRVFQQRLEGYRARKPWREERDKPGTGGLVAPVVSYVEKEPKRSDNAAAEELFVARPLTDENSFTAGIEGPACDATGNLYVVNLKRTGDIGRVTPDGKLDVFVELPEKSAGNGIVFDRQGLMYVADYAAHNILRIDPRTKAIDVFAHEAMMSQPNDLAIAPNGTIYASDPNWGASTGQLWMLPVGGKLTRVAAEMGTTNGIEVSPDGKTLYVNESVQRNIWAFAISPDGTLGEKRLLKKFDDHGFDGMRCDVGGNLYVTRYGKGTVAKVSPDGEVLKEIDVLGKSPSNLCFGGLDGRTVYVTEVEHRRVVEFRVDRPGVSHARFRTTDR